MKIQFKLYEDGYYCKYYKIVINGVQNKTYELLKDNRFGGYAIIDTTKPKKWNGMTDLPYIVRSFNVQKEAKEHLNNICEIIFQCGLTI